MGLKFKTCDARRRHGCLLAPRASLPRRRLSAQDREIIPINITFNVAEGSVGESRMRRPSRALTRSPARPSCS